MRLFSYTVEYRMACACCDEEVTEGPYVVLAAGIAQQPHCPPGWQVLEGNLICPAHTIRVTSEGGKKVIPGG